MRLPRDQVVTLEGRVREHLAPAKVNAPFKAVIEDETGDVTLVFFRNNASWVEKALPIGSTRWVSGRLELWDGRLQMVHPDRVMDADGLRDMPLIEPVYPLTEGLFPRVLGRAIEAALERLPRLPEWLDPNTSVSAGMAWVRRGDPRPASPRERRSRRCERAGPAAGGL